MKSQQIVNDIEASSLKIELTVSEALELWKMYSTRKESFSTREARRLKSTSLDAKLIHLHDQVKKIIRPEGLIE